MAYQPPLEDILFQLKNVVGYSRLHNRFPEADIDTIGQILDTAGKIAVDAYGPLRRKMDLEPAVLVGDNVKTPDGVGEALATLADAGLVSVAASEAHGGAGLPFVVQSAVNELMGSANLALALQALLTQGQIEMFEAHANDNIAAQVIPNLVSGEWSGTMLLTEPHAGTDIGALTSRAVPNDDGSYAITGQKIFITWGEHPHAKNISHATLARLPDAPAGPKGISLFYVPKILPDGTRNSIRAISLEHKMGIHGSPTCVMEMENAKGWLVGQPNQGLPAMFTMMNNARQAVGVQGVSIAEASYQDARDYALERVQGRTAPHGTIIDHADVRRMLLEMKTKAAIARAITYDTAIAIDLGRSDGEMRARAGVLTPLAKSYATDVGTENASDAIQVWGGMGFVEESGIAQYYRDARITPIYEGTNGVQAMDLVGRKMSDDGAAIFALIDSLEIDVAIADALRAATEALLRRDIGARGADAARYQRAFAEVLGAHYLTLGAKASSVYEVMLNDHLSQTIPRALASLAIIAAAPRELNTLSAEEF